MNNRKIIKFKVFIFGIAIITIISVVVILDSIIKLIY